MLNNSVSIIHHYKGDLLQACLSGDTHVIGHQTNCFNTQGSGIAGSLKKICKRPFEVDCTTAKGDRRKLGQFTKTYTSTNPSFLVYNLYGQYRYGANKQLIYTVYDALRSSLTKMYLDLVALYTFESKPLSECVVGFPLIGCGLAGGDWKVVEKIIEEVFEDFLGEVRVYTL